MTTMLVKSVLLTGIVILLSIIFLSYDLFMILFIKIHKSTNATYSPF